MYIYTVYVYIYTVYHENDDDQPSSRSTSWVIFIAIVYGMEGQFLLYLAPPTNRVCGLVHPISGLTLLIYTYLIYSITRNI